MKAFKIIDFLLQVVLIVVGIVMIVFFGGMNLERIDFFIGYFLIGAWQISSVVVHFFYQAPYETHMRKLYLFALAVVTIFVVLAVFIDRIFLFTAEILLFFSPVMALYYLVVCFVETKWLIEADNAQ